MRATVRITSYSDFYYFYPAMLALFYILEQDIQWRFIEPRVVRKCK
jgi:hypothetical protein